MVAHKNFYETIQEAKMRLRNTVVRYKDNFYYVLEVGDHMEDGKFRVYMDELGHGCVGRDRLIGFPAAHDYTGSNRCAAYDAYIEKNPTSGFIRKFADSRHFEKFRPFPLGNVNINGSVIYTERSPTRNMHQGLLQEAVMPTTVQSVPARWDPNSYGRRVGRTAAPINNATIDIFSAEFHDMLLGNYPSYLEVVTNLRDPSIMNDGCAFHREYSIMRGPLDTLLLCYKHSGVGIIDSDNTLTIGTTHEFLREELTELGVFNDIYIKEVRNDA